MYVVSSTNVYFHPIFHQGDVIYLLETYVLSLHCSGPDYYGLLWTLHRVIATSNRKYIYFRFLLRFIALLFTESYCILSKYYMSVCVYDHPLV